MTRLSPLLALSLACFLVQGLTARPPEKPPEKSQKDTDRIFNLFVSELVELKPGSTGKPASFQMGSRSKTAPRNETPCLEITLATPFRIARYEVTQELYAAVMETNPSRWKGPRNSVEMVNWEEATSFCKKLTTLLREGKLIKANEEVRLPSEAEWEYACRAGTSTEYSFGNDPMDLGAYGWFTGNAKGNDPPVGKKKPNPWGLYDMHGYVWEWCADAWHPNHEDASPSGLARVKPDEKGRVIRGGSWAHTADKCRSAARERAILTTRSDAIGFRCVVAPVPGKTTSPKESK